MCPPLFLFDYDGVIADSLPIYYARVQEALTRMGHHFITTPEDYLRLFEGNFYRSLEERGVDVRTFSRVVSALPPQDTPIYPFMIPILNTLAQRAILVIISSNGRAAIEASLVQRGLRDLFRAVMGSETAFSKEDKIRRARKTIAPDTKEVFYIGDTVGDIKEGRACGVKTVAVGWGWHTIEQLAAAQPDYLIPKPEGLLTLFPPS